MTSNVYCMWDRVAEESGPVWVAKSDAVAIRHARNFTKEVRADEYRLYCLGSYDSEAVVLKALEIAREVVIPSPVELTSRSDVEVR